MKESTAQKQQDNAYARVNEKLDASFSGQKEEIVFRFRYNLDARNAGVSGGGAICGKALHLCTENGEVQKYDILSLDEIEYVQHIGCASIEYQIDGESAELCRTDMHNALLLQAATKRLRAIRDGRTVRKDDHDETGFCPKCGRPLRAGSSICTHCLDKGKLIFRLLPFAKPYFGRILLAVLCFFAITGVNLLTPFVNRILVDDYLTADVPKENGFFTVIAVLAGAALMIALLQAFRSIILVRVGNKIVVNLREVVYRKVQAMTLAGVSKRTAGEIITRITQDTATLKDFLTSVLPDLLQMGILFVTVIIAMFFMNWTLTLLILVPIPLVFLMFYGLRGFMHRLYHRQWQAESNVNSLLHDIFSGIRVVKVFGTEAYESERFNKAAKKVAEISKRNERTWNMIMPFANFLLGIGEYAVLFYVGSRVIDGSMTLGQLTQFITYVGIIYGPIRWAAFLPRQLTRAMTSLAKVFELIDDEPEIGDSDGALTAPVHGDIAFRDVSFGYNNYEDVLKHIDADIHPGEMVGIVGRSGVGKSTMINLVMRLYDVTGGKLEIDGHDIREYNQHALRSQIGVVLQETFLFKGTIYNNIAYAKPGCTYDEVLRASRVANAHQFIMKLPDGYNTIVGERGQTLSGGERQRIAIARAILRDPRILILDEATASLDTETEKLIQDAVNALVSGRTTIAIAHRLSTLRNATRLIVLEKGSVEESGTHDELMRRKGRYFKLVMAQRQMSKMKK